MKDLYRQLEKIEKSGKIEEKDMSLISELSKNDNSEIRSFVAELLVLANSKSAEKILINMCNDSDELVRVNACDSLSMFCSEDVFNVLIARALNDKSNLVRSYALLSIIDIMEHINIRKDLLKTLFLKSLDNSSVGIKNACYKGLYKLGEEKYLDEILNLLLSESYQERCLVVNSMFDLINKKNANKISTFLNCLINNEESKAVKSLILDLLDEIKHIS